MESLTASVRKLDDSYEGAQGRSKHNINVHKDKDETVRFGNSQLAVICQEKVQCTGKRQEEGS